MNLQEKYEKVESLLNEALEIAKTEDDITLMFVHGNGEEGISAGSYNDFELAKLLASSVDGFERLKKVILLAIAMKEIITEEEEAEDDE